MFQRSLLILIIVLTFTVATACGTLTVNFEDLSLPDSESAWSGTYPVDGTGGTGDSTSFSSGGVAFNNFSDGDWAFWEGFAYSNMSDATTAGAGNSFSAYTGTGYDSGDDIYAVGYVGYSTIPTITLPTEVGLTGVYFTNTTYAALAMRDGDNFTKKFGGASGDDPDWFMLTITGKDGAGAVTDTVEFYLADYTSADNGLDYIVDSWEYVDLSGLGVVKTLEFALSSTDTGDYGMNTPAYFAMDSLIIVPEPATVVLLALGGLVIRKRRV